MLYTAGQEVEKVRFRIRAMEPFEYSVLTDFLYEAIFQKADTPPLPKSVIEEPALWQYIENFGSRAEDYCLCAEVEGEIVGAVWVRNIHGFGSIDEQTPEFAISIRKKYRGYGIGAQLMDAMLKQLKEEGWEKASLAVQKENYALRMYLKAGFTIIGENEEEYIMVYRF